MAAQAAVGTPHRSIRKDRRLWEPSLGHGEPKGCKEGCADVWTSEIEPAASIGRSQEEA